MGSLAEIKVESFRLDNLYRIYILKDIWQCRGSTCGKVMEFLREPRLNVSTYSSSSIFRVTRILATSVTSLRIRKGCHFWVSSCHLFWGPFFGVSWTEGLVALRRRSNAAGTWDLCWSRRRLLSLSNQIFPSAGEFSNQKAGWFT